jgi:hypothetical protein
MMRKQLFISNHKNCIRFGFLFVFVLLSQSSFCWGFFGHQKINRLAVFLLPPEMVIFYKQHSHFLAEHSVDPDKRRYAVDEEGPRHYIDLDLYGKFPFDSLPRDWNTAVKKYSADTLQSRGVVPWWIHTMYQRLVKSFKERNVSGILRNSAEIGHYIADAHVPLHAHHNHNGQYTNQRGIHGFWESRVPELLADDRWHFFIGKASYIREPLNYIWSRVLESAAAADTVLTTERMLTDSFPSSQKYAFEKRNGKLVRQYSSAFTIAYDSKLKGMIERRMRQSIFTVASFWYTAWVDAGQPDLSALAGEELSSQDLAELEALNMAWRSGQIKGRAEAH